jgi:DNA topoisomerase-1
MELSHREFLTIDRDYEQAAASNHLTYVKPDSPGIIRRRSGTGFTYVYRGAAVREEKTLQRIKKLVLPPAWRDVWICAQPTGHIQATGLDVRGRKQYRYHARWNAVRKETKFHRLFEFGKVLPQIRKRLKEDISAKELSERKVLAAVIMLMERTYIRIGSAEYERTNGSYGLTTLKDKHVTFDGDDIKFSFIGKKGIHHHITLHDKRLARIVKECRDIAGKELFQYYDADGKPCPIDSGTVNAYIKEISGGDFSAKDFRLWAGSVNMLKLLTDIGPAETASKGKKNIVSALDGVSEKLGNTRTVCRNYYVHPGIISLYEENKLVKLVRAHKGETSGFSNEEHHLMNVLKSLV